MLVNLHKTDVVKALGLYETDSLRASRRRFKRNAMRYTRLFGFKFRSYEEAKKAYVKDEPFYGFIEDNVYGHREYMYGESIIRDLRLITNHDVKDVVALELDYVKQLERYLVQ